VEADPRMLHHILINLLGNAAKFAPAGSPIRVEGRRDPDGLRLAILDEGPGLPEGKKEQLFDRFTRVVGDDMTGGTGLGLAIVKGFADAMGLGLAASNRTGQQGSRFEVVWPVSLLRKGQTETSAK
ncbi:MAG: ATP-binding protein, partial [Burkholderiales bacterium]